MRLRKHAASIGRLVSARDVNQVYFSTSFHSAFKQDCSVCYVATGVTDLTASGDDALAVGNYDRAIELYSAVIDLDFATSTIFVNRSKARSGKMLWDDALFDAEKVR
jgi:hypothetical protein